MALLSPQPVLVDENGNARSADPPLPAARSALSQPSPAVHPGRRRTRLRVVDIDGPPPAPTITQLAANPPGSRRDDEALPRPPHAEANHTSQAHEQRPGHRRPDVYRHRPTPPSRLLLLLKSGTEEAAPGDMPEIHNPDDPRTSEPGPFFANYLSEGPDEEPYEGEEPLLQHAPRSSRHDAIAPSVSC